MRRGPLRETLRAAFVIGRRDVQATVFSRTFLLFLLGPMFPLLFGVAFTMVSGPGGRAGGASGALVVIGPPAEAQAIARAGDRIASAVPDLPSIRVAPAKEVRQAARLLRDPRARAAAVLVTGGRAATLMAPADRIEALRGPVALLIDDASRDSLLAHATGGIVPSVTLALRPIASPPPTPDHADLARMGQTALFALTILLASMLLSNMVEEKSSKVVEVLAAAVPVRAIFLGKLFGMLAISLLGLAVWGSAAALGARFLLPVGQAPTPPAIGWPLFALLGFCYFATNYLLLGALFLGIGSHARSVREVQTLSMPVTMAQLVLFALAGSVVADPAGGLARAAMVFPWSSPLAMLGTAAMSPAGWVHPLALGWQLLWVAGSIVVSAALFRRNVLKTGAPAPRWRRRAKGQ